MPPFKFKSFRYTKVSSSFKKIYDNVDRLLPYAKTIYESAKRYACVSGGRSSTKTSQAGALITLMRVTDPKYANSKHVCARLFATNLETTTWDTVCLVMESEGITDQFVLNKSKKEMLHKATGSKLTFTGLQNPKLIKSLSNIATLWIDEAEGVSNDTLEIICPTVRGDLSNPKAYNPKIIFTYNPLLPVDEVRAYCNKNKDDCDFAHVNIFDLPEKYQNEIMLKEAEVDRKEDIEYFNWKWLGLPHPRLSAMPFANCDFTTEKLITNATPVFAFLDPSFKGLDTTALTILQANPKGGVNVAGFVWQDSWHGCGDKIVEKLAQYNVRKAFYENNALNEIVYIHFRDNYGIFIEGKPTYTNKANKISDAGYHAKILTFLTTSETDNKRYNEQIKKWNVKVTTNPKAGEHDDAPDSLASLLHLLRK